MKVKVNQECIGCGMCIDMCPEVFEYNDEGLSSVKSEEADDSLKDSITEAQQACPVDAIELIDDQQAGSVDTTEV
ncbi:MAG: ferredoxin [Clostridia bacterium]|nr:ferredoxin [Clostridia bacterium]